MVLSDVPTQLTVAPFNGTSFSSNTTPFINRVFCPRIVKEVNEQKINNNNFFMTFVFIINLTLSLSKLNSPYLRIFLLNREDIHLLDYGNLHI